MALKKIFCHDDINDKRDKLLLKFVTPCYIVFINAISFSVGVKK